MKKGLSQETLKIIACVTMLIDHVGAVFFPVNWMRVVGRISFPIYCFLLTEGITHTRNPGKYTLRLLVGAVLAELPFDLLFYGGITWQSQSVMLTLALGLGMIYWARKSGSMILPFTVCFFAAEFLKINYGGWGVALIALFALTANLSGGWLLQLVGMAVIFYAMDSYRMPMFGFRIPIQLFGLLALIPIRFYSGRKLTKNKALQIAFYLFYPAHLVILLLIQWIL